MDNAPTRPPGRHRHGRRPPRGPRLVPISRRDQERVDNLKKAAAHLRRTGAPEELAREVEFVMTDEGANFVGRLRWQSAADENPNLALSLPTVQRDEINANVSAAGKTVQAQAIAALNAFLNGDFVPARPVRAARGTVASRSNLNMRVATDMRKRVDERARQLHADGVLDWAPTTSQVLKAWFVERFTSQPGS